VLASALGGCQSAVERDLMTAAQRGRRDVAMEALLQGARVDTQDAQGTSPLMLAAAGGHDDLVRFLLQRGAKVDLRRHDGVTALLLAVTHQRESVVRTLLEAGASVQTTGPRFGLRDMTPLHTWVLSGGQGAIGRMLLEAGADPRSQAQDDLTPVDLAVIGGRGEALGVLLAYAEPARRDALTRRALIEAVRRGQARVVEALLRTGADAETATPRGRPVLNLAIASGHGRIVELLLEAGASVSRADPGGLTPLHWAVRHDRVEIARLLLQRGASPEAQGGAGLSPLAEARDRGSARMVSLLVEAGEPAN
jgi:ankyrin repeat protein